MKKNLITRTIMAACCLMLFSFSANRGGDHFEIYVKGKMVLQEFVHNAKGVRQIDLAKGGDYDRVEVYYSHCGVNGTQRVLSVKDASNKVLKQWTFVDVKKGKSRMSLRINEVLKLQKNRDAKLALYYTSGELPEGKLLANINTGGGEKLSRMAGF